MAVDQAAMDDMAPGNDAVLPLLQVGMLAIEIFAAKVFSDLNDA